MLAWGGQAYLHDSSTSKVRCPTSGVRTWNGVAGDAGQSSGGPHDAAVDGVTGTLPMHRCAMSTETVSESASDHAGDAGYDVGPQDVAVRGVAGQSCNWRAAMSGDGKREMLETEKAS